MSDRAAPESMRALQYFPVCSEIFRPSVMSATVICLFEGSHPCSWKSLLGEGSISLKDHIPFPGHWGDHQSCNTLCVDPLSSPLFSSWDVAFTLSC